VTTRLTAIALALLTLAVGLSVAPASGAARPTARRARVENATSTRAYIAANYTLVRVARENLATGKAAIDALAERVAGECPLVAKEAPQNRDSEQLSDEVVGALEIAAYQSDRASMLAFAHAVRGLRWTNHRLDRMVGTYATKLEGFPALAMPDICADVSAWAASGFATLPASTIGFDAGFEADDIEAEEVSLRLLRPYEGAGGAALLRRTKQLEEPLAEAEAEAVSDYSKILDALKLPQ
jgi:hypothetical protein